MGETVHAWLIKHADDIWVGVIAGLIVTASFAAFSAVREWLWTHLPDAWKKLGRWKMKPPSETDTAAISVRRYLLSVSLMALAIACLAVWNWQRSRDITTLKDVIASSVLPRHISKEQIDAVGKYLVAHSQPHEVRIKWILGDAEAQRYAGDFYSALIAGNWLPIMSPVNPAVVTCRPNPPGSSPLLACSSQLEQMMNRMDGISIEGSGPNPPPPTTLEERAHPPTPPYQILGEALRASGVDVPGYGYGYNNDPVDTVTIYVGNRVTGNESMPQ